MTGARLRVRWTSALPPAPPPPLGSAVHIVQSHHVPPTDPDGPIVDGIPFDEHEVYVINHNINRAGALSIANPAGVVVAQASPSLVYQFGAGDVLYDAIRAAAIAGPHSEASTFFHTSLPATSSNRLLHPSGSYYVRPSGAWGTTCGQVIAANIDPDLYGVLLDECQGITPDTIGVPEAYWTAWRTAADGPGAGERVLYNGLWLLNILNCMAECKAVFGSGRAVYANTALQAYELNCDGIMAEGQHIDANPVLAEARFQLQQTYWNASPVKFGAHVGNMAYDHVLQIAGVVFRCYVLP